MDVARSTPQGAHYYADFMILFICCCLDIAPRAQSLKKSAWLLRLIGDKAPPATGDSSEAARTLNRRCYPHIGNGEHSLPSRTKPWMLPSPRHRGFTTMRTLFTCCLNWKLKNNGKVGLGVHQLGSRPTFFIPCWTTHLCILYQVCATRGATVSQKQYQHGITFFTKFSLLNHQFSPLFY